MPRGIFYTAAAMLLLALAPLPYAYYELLRLVVCGTFGYLGYLALQRKYRANAAVFLVAALMFNPLIPLYFDRGVWAGIDIAAAITLLVARKRYGDR